MSSKTGFDSVPAFDGSNWLSWSTRMSQFLITQKLWAYISGLITKPALESTAPSTAASRSATAKSVKAHNDWVTEDSAVIGYIKMKYTESVVVGIPWCTWLQKKSGTVSRSASTRHLLPSCSKRYDKPSTSGCLVEIPSMRSPNSQRCSVAWVAGDSPSLSSFMPPF